jgi:hypothetical protein
MTTFLLQRAERVNTKSASSVFAFFVVVVVMGGGKKYRISAC